VHPALPDVKAAVSWEVEVQVRVRGVRQKRSDDDKEAGDAPSAEEMECLHRSGQQSWDVM
jgi:hypothetical protein